MTKPQFLNWDDYLVPVLRVLAELPDGEGEARDVIDMFWRRYKDQIPRTALRPVSEKSTGETWSNRIRGSRMRLKDMGFLEAPEHGVWRITQAGRNWLAQNPQETHIKEVNRRRSSPGAHNNRYSSSPSSKTTPAGITFEMLEQTRRVLPAEQFRRIWGVIYDELLAEERMKSITPVNDGLLAVRANKPVRRIQDFLQGRSLDMPKSEEICDWIHFCYAMELHREVAALWQYVRQDAVNPWQYERTKKVATVSRTKAGV